MLDLTEETFIPEFTVACVYGGSPLVYGAIIERRYEHGRPGVSGEFSPESRTGNANHALIYLRRCDPGLIGITPQVGDRLKADGTEWRVRIIRAGVGGAYELLCEEDGSRAVNWERNAPGSHLRS